MSACRGEGAPGPHRPWIVMSICFLAAFLPSSMKPTTLGTCTHMRGTCQCHVFMTLGHNYALSFPERSSTWLGLRKDGAAVTVRIQPVSFHGQLVCYDTMHEGTRQTCLWCYVTSFCRQHGCMPGDLSHAGEAGKEEDIWRMRNRP